jgi:hypothetical protein
MARWLKQLFGGDRPRAPKTVDEAMAAFGSLIERYPVAIMDVSMLPVPKKQMKALLKALYAKATSSQVQNHIEVGFTLLCMFQEGVGPTPVDGNFAPKGAAPTDAEIAKLDRWLAWQKRSTAEAEDLLAEWKRYLAGEPI